MILAHIFLPAMLIVICKSQSSSQFNDQLTIEKSPDLYSFTGPSGVDLSPTNNNEELLDNYRQFVAKSLIKLHDFCRVYNFLQSIKFNLNGDALDGFPSLDEKQRGEDTYIHSMMRLLDKNRNADVSLFLRGQSDTEAPKSALFYYLSVSLLLQDSELDQTIKYLMRGKCCNNANRSSSNDDCSDSALDKRNNIKKVKFHSWGGKRSGGNGGGENSRVSNSDLGKDSGQSKVVIRTPFRPWGGKREQRQENTNSYYEVLR